MHCAPQWRPSRNDALLWCDALAFQEMSPFAVKQFMTHPPISCPARPHSRSADRLAWLLLTGWLTASGFALAGHMLDKPADLCTSPRTLTVTNKVSP